MAQFPFTERGTVTSYPLLTRESFSSQDVTFNDFSTQTYSRLAQPLGRWELDFNPIDDVDYETIRQFIIGQQGRGQMFMFVDPSENLLTQTEVFESASWIKGTDLVVGKNYLTRSEEIDHADWVKLGPPSAPVITADQDTSPDNTTTADQVDFPASGAAQFPQIRQDVTGALPKLSLQTLTGSIWVRASSAVSLVLRISGDTTGTNNTINITTVWQRFTVSHTLLVGDTTAKYQLFQDENKTARTVFVWGAQLEYGSVAADYTKTVSATTELLIADPFWTANPLDSDHPSALTKRGRQIVNTDTSLTRALSQTLTLDVAGGFFTNSLYLKSQSGTSTGTLELSSSRNAISTQSETFTTSYSVGTSAWERITVSPRFSKGNFDDEIFYALNVPSLSTIHVFGAQLETESSPSQYMKNTYHSGLHTACRFAENSFTKDMRSLNNSRLSLTIEEEI